MPIFSLPNEYGIGDFGKTAYEFVDFLSGAGQSFWQILPLQQTGYGDSPYSSCYAQSINPYFISPKKLYEQGLLEMEDLKELENSCFYVDYGFLYQTRYKALRKAFKLYDKENQEYIKFVNSKRFYDYALYLTLKERYNQKDFYWWDKPYKYRDKKALNKFAKENIESIRFWQFVQFIGEKQWLELKAYANSKGIKIIGDMPLYVAYDSVDVWKNPEAFKLDKNLKPVKVAGVPPDYFSCDGQLWGNPVYKYKNHEKTNFKWWKDRIRNALKIFDVIRIDHFRGLDRFYEIDAKRDNAKQGKWVKVPSRKLFQELKKVISANRMIAEDLGTIDDGVKELLKFVKCAGMKVLSFAFDGNKNNPYLPENIESNSVCFTGTHDNDTLVGLINSLSANEREKLIRLVNESLSKLKEAPCFSNTESIAKGIIRLGYKSKAKLVIMPMQDVTLLGGEYRVNEPGTLKEQNWAVRFNHGDYNKEHIDYLLELNKDYKRNKKTLIK